jgi:hypothetical protein
MDGKIEKAELKGELGTKLAANFQRIDANSSGGIENAELQAALQAMFGGEGRRREQAQQQPMPAAPTPAKPGGR